MIHTFGAFELDVLRFELRKNRQVVSVPPKVFDLLRCLVERHDAVVSHAELMKLVWPGISITKDSLTQLVMLARAALEEDVERPRFIETVRGRGYRFAGPVGSRTRAGDERLGEASTPAAAASSESVRTTTSREPSGRAAHQALLEERLERAREGHGGIVLVTGEAGIGKTHLVHALLPQEDGTDALFVKCYEGDGAPELWPFVQALRALEAKGVPLAGDLASLAAGTLVAGTLDAPSSRFALFDRCVRVLLEHAVKRPTLIVIDDFQRADSHSIGLLAVLAPQVRTSRLLVVVAYDSAAPRIPIFGASMAALAHEPTTTLLRVGPLTHEEVTAILSTETGRKPNVGLVEKLLDKTKGNPLLLSQLIRVVRGTDRGDGDQMATSTLVGGDDLRDAVTHMLQTLPETTLRILTVASVFGREFPLTPLATAIGMSNADVLHELDSASLARVVARSGDSYRFTYPLVGDVLYRRLPVAKRAKLHAVVATALRERLGAEADHGRVGEIARHLVEAAAMGDVDAAVDWSLRAIDLANAAGDAAASARYAKRGLEAMRFAVRPDEERRARLNAALAR